MRRFIALALGLILILGACTPGNPDDAEIPDDPGNGGDSGTVTDTAGYTAMRVGGEEISGNEYRYHYYSTVQSFVNIYGLYMGIDMDMPFEEQSFDGDITWADFFEEQTVIGIINAVLLSEQAKKEGITLSPLLTDEIESQIDNIKSYCEQNDMSIPEALAEYFGGNMDEAALRAVMERVYLGYQYELLKRDMMGISDAEIEEFYNLNADEYDEVDYLIYMFSPEFGDDGYTVTDTSKAEADAAALIEAVSDRESFLNYISDVLGDYPDSALVTSGINEGDEISAWLYDASRGEGDTGAVESNGYFYAIYFIARYRPDYSALSIRHVLMSSENSTADDARERAEQLYESWKNGAADERSFAEMAMNHSQDNGSVFTGGLYEDVYEGQMVETFDAWCFDPSRGYGDTGLVDTEFGTHIMFYVGYVEMWKSLVRQTISDNAYNDFYNALLPLYEPEKINMDVSK